jgi:hypothetical protein
LDRPADAVTVVREFLASDIGDDVSALELVTRHVREPGPAPWGFTGDSCHVSVGPDEVHVANDFSGQEVTLPRTEFLRLLDEHAGAIRG